MTWAKEEQSRACASNAVSMPGRAGTSWTFPGNGNLTQLRVTDETATIATNVNKSGRRPAHAPYPEYLDANFQIVSDLQTAINSTIDFEQTKAKIDALQAQLPG